MAAKDIKTAIAMGLCVGPLNKVTESLYNELKDFIAHEVMKENRQRKLEEADGPVYAHPDQILLRFFLRLFPNDK